MMGIDEMRVIDNEIQGIMRESVAFVAKRMLPMPAREFWPSVDSIGGDTVIVKPRGFHKAEQCYSFSLFLNSRGIRHEFRGTRVLVINETDFLKVFK